MIRSFFGTTMVIALVAGCGDAGKEAKPSEPIAFDDIDLAKWEAALVGTGDVREDPDLKTLYRLTINDCEADEEQFAIKLSLAGSMPDVSRINLAYVCPSEAHKVDVALAQMQSLDQKYDELCAKPPSQRTSEEQDELDAVYDQKDACT